MAITYPTQTPGSAFSLVSGNTLDITYTVPSGTELLLIGGFGRDTTISSIEDWTTTTEPFVELPAAFDAQGAGANDIDMKVWGIINPTAKANTITVTYEDTVNWRCAWMASYAGNDTTSVADAVNFLEYNADAATVAVFESTSVLASAGTAGNALIVMGGHISDEGANTSSIDAAFTEIIDDTTLNSAIGNGGAGWYMAHLLDGAPDAATITWGNNNYSRGLMFEIVAASGAVYINDTDDLVGAVEQTYPTTWTDTSLTLPDAPDTTGLSGQLYVLVETATGAVASRAITVGSAGADVTDFPLVDLAAAAQASLTSLKWSWFDQADPKDFVAPVNEGTTESTDASGNLTLDLSSSTLTTGQTGCLMLSNADGSLIGLYRIAVD